WGQGATHSQSLQSIFGHFPGLYVAAPSSPADAKGLLVQALRLDTPVVLLENRSLRIARQGMDVTVVAVSLMVYEAYRAAELLAGQGVSVEVVDIRSIRPLDEAIICDSVARTGHLVVADTSWARYGFAAEVAAVVAEHALDSLRAPVRRVTLPDCPAPVSWPLENAFHPSAGKIAEACLGVLRADPGSVPELSDVTAGFVGPY
ncbi:MAG: transketolase C-terminal domain-containing protein, partial [Sciscionella sp.]